MFLSESQLQHFWTHFHSYETVIYCVTILHKWQNTNARTKGWCSHLREHRAEKLFKPRQGEIRWFGLASPLTREKVTPTESFFGARRFDPPFMDLKKTKTFFQCRGFESLRNSLDEGRPVLFQCCGALLICQSKALSRTSGWPQPTLLIQEHISYVPRTCINGYC